MKKHIPVPASLPARLIAYAIDWYLSAMLFAVSISLFASIEAGDLILTNTITILSFPSACGALAIGIVLVLFYYCYPILLKKNEGQTIGKHILGIRIIKADQTPLSIKDYLLRYLLGMILIEQNMNMCSFMIRSVLGMVIPSLIVSIVYDIGVVLCLISVVLVFGKQHRMIHDRIAHTIVVPNKP